TRRKEAAAAAATTASGAAGAAAGAATDGAAEAAASPAAISGRGDIEGGEDGGLAHAAPARPPDARRVPAAARCAERPRVHYRRPPGEFQVSLIEDGAARPKTAAPLVAVAATGQPACQRQIFQRQSALRQTAPPT